jgi:hypothetical protein
MKKEEFLFCKDLQELSDTVSKYVHASLGVDVERRQRTFIVYPIVFKVDDTPSKRKWDKMDATDKANAYYGASGCYGIRSIGHEFDAETTKLACCSYGGRTIAVTPQLDEDSSEDDVAKAVYDMIDEATCCDDRKNILVRISQIVESMEYHG